MFKISKASIAAMLLITGWLGCVCGPAAAAVRIEGQVHRWWSGRELDGHSMGRECRGSPATRSSYN